MSLLEQIQNAQRDAGEAVVIAHLNSLGLSNVTAKKDPYASKAASEAMVMTDTRTPAEKRLHELIEAESAPELCGSDYSQALYKAALKLVAVERNQTVRLDWLREVIKNDSYCAGFQTMGQFRAALMNMMDLGEFAQQPARQKTQTGEPL